MGEVPRARALHQRLDLGLDQELHRPIAPFDHGAQPLAVRVHHRIGGNSQGSSADHELRRESLREVRQHRALM